MPLALAMAAVAVHLAVVSVESVRGECDGPYPSFQDTVPAAERVIYGDVVAVQPVDWGIGDGRTSRFTVQGASLLGEIRFERLDVTDVMATECSGYLVARMGDRVAIAFGGRPFAAGGPANAIAWVVGDPPDGEGLESITEPELFGLIGIDRAAFAASVDSETSTPWLPVAAVTAALVLVGVAVAWRRRADEAV